MITAEQKQKWVDALRSGEYKQAKGVLKTDRGFCCLGVLADCAIPEARWVKGVRYYLSHDLYDSFALVLPTEIMPVNISNVLTRMNDNGKSFDEIADWIEENL